MNQILITGMFDSEALEIFIKSWNESNKSDDKSKVIYIDSVGGLISAFQVVKNIIDSNKDEVTLIAAGEIHSGAFELFFSVKCKRIILPFTFGMYHFGYDDITVDEYGKAKDEYSKARMANLKLMKSTTVSFCKKIGMNHKEVELIKSGKDVFFQQDRLNHFLHATSK